MSVANGPPPQHDLVEELAVAIIRLPDSDRDAFTARVIDGYIDKVRETRPELREDNVLADANNFAFALIRRLVQIERSLAGGPEVHAPSRFGTHLINA